MTGEPQTILDMGEELPPEEPAPKLKPAVPSGKITIAEICEALMNEASRINTAQHALVDCGWRSRFDASQKRRELLFVAAADMLWRLEPHQEEIKRILSEDKPKKAKR